jgi:hypothetical protein
LVACRYRELAAGAIRIFGIIIQPGERVKRAARCQCTGGSLVTAGAIDRPG